MTIFKEVFDKKINQEDIYQSIIYKNKTFDLKPVLTCVCLLFIASLLLKPNVNEIKNGENILYIHEKKQSEFINQDLDVRISDSTSFNSIMMYSKFPFLKELENYKNYEWDIYFMYIRENINSNNYSILHDYVVTMKNDESNINIAFSEIEPPLRCVIVESNKKESLVNNVKMVIQQFNDSYYVNFSHNGIYYDIEAMGTHLDDLVEILEIITK